MTDSIYINFKYWYAYFQEGLILDLFYLFSQRFNNIKTKLKYLKLFSLRQNMCFTACEQNLSNPFLISQVQKNELIYTENVIVCGQ